MKESRNLIGLLAVAAALSFAGNGERPGKTLPV